MKPTHSPQSSAAHCFRRIPAAAKALILLVMLAGDNCYVLATRQLDQTGMC